MYGAVGLSMLAPPAIDGRPLIDSIYLFQSTLLTGLVVYGLSRLAALVRQLHETKNELARMAVTKERLRISRNLHDLLGYSLSAITLKSELIHRLVLTQPQRAKAEIEDVLALSRQSLADVRRVSRGLRDMSLQSELASVTGLLEATDVKVSTEVRLDELGPEVNTVLAAVLREAITNMLRHSRATECSIEAVQDCGRVRLVVTNDGVAAVYRDTSQDSGAGLQNLAMRLRSVSGRLTIAHGSDGTFRLTAEAPVAFVAAPGKRARRPSAGLGPRSRRRCRAPARPPDSSYPPISGDPPRRHHGPTRPRGVTAMDIRILLAEDMHMVRGALVALLSLQDDLTVVCEVARGDEIVQAALEHRPDVAVIDIDLPGLDGLSAAARLRERMPECRILILTNLGRPGTLRRALMAQVSGYLLKDAPPGELASAIRRVAAGQRVIDPQLALDTWNSEETPLTERETEVLQLAAEGRDPAEIAKVLRLSLGTVRNYLTTIVSKLNARNRVDAIRTAREAGWLV